MFRSMFRTKAQKEEDFERMNERVFPFGKAQEEMTYDMVIEISRETTDDPLVFFFYLSAYDMYHKEIESGKVPETKRLLGKLKPKLSPQAENQLLMLMELTYGMKSLEDFPNVGEIIRKSNKK